MAYTLVDIENKSSGLNQRKGIADALEGAIKKTYYKDEEDARQFYLGQTERKRDLGGKYNALALDDSYDEPYETDEDEDTEE